jgi:DNA-binding response OmpR family regulator
LLIDGDPASSKVLADQLERTGLAEVDVVGDSEAALGDAAAYALALLSVPAADPIAAGFLRRWQTRWPGIPLVLLVGPGEPVDAEGWMVAVLNRPLRLNQLQSAIETLLARGSAADASAIGPYRLRLGEKLLVDPAGPREIRLTEKEAAILDCLARAGDRFLSRELLLNEVWGYRSGVTTHTLETHVYRLRRKIEADPARAEILLSEPGGYRLVARAFQGDVVMDQRKS